MVPPSALQSPEDVQEPLDGPVEFLVGDGQRRGEADGLLVGVLAQQAFGQQLRAQLGCGPGGRVDVDPDPQATAAQRDGDRARPAVQGDGPAAPLWEVSSWSTSTVIAGRGVAEGRQVGLQ